MLGQGLVKDVQLRIVKHISIKIQMHVVHVLQEHQRVLQIHQQVVVHVVMQQGYLHGLASVQ